MAETKEFSVEELEQMLKDKKAAAQKELDAKKKKYTRSKEEYINLMVSAFAQAAHDLMQLKQDAIDKGSELHKQMYEIFEKEEKHQNQFSLESEDGMHKVVIERQNRQSFNEQAEVHINTIKDILKEKFAGRNKSMYGIIDGILMKNRKGDYDEKLVTKLNQHRDKVDDERFNEALDELAKCYQTYESSTYVRCYKKAEDNSWENINIQFSSL